MNLFGFIREKITELFRGDTVVRDLSAGNSLPETSLIEKKDREVVQFNERIEHIFYLIDDIPGRVTPDRRVQAELRQSQVDDTVQTQIPPIYIFVPKSFSFSTLTELSERRKEEIKRREEEVRRQKAERERLEAAERAAFLEKQQQTVAKIRERQRLELKRQQENKLKLQPLQKLLKRKEDWRDFQEVLEENGIDAFYHFTDRRNIASIKRNGAFLLGLLCPEWDRYSGSRRR